MWQFVNVCHICDRIDRKAPERFFVQEIKCSFSFSALLEAVFAAARSRRWIIKPIINAMKLPFMVYSTLCQRVQSKVNGLKGGKLTVLNGDGHEKVNCPSSNGWFWAKPRTLVQGPLQKSGRSWTITLTQRHSWGRPFLSKIPSNNSSRYLTYICVNHFLIHQQPKDKLAILKPRLMVQ